MYFINQEHKRNFDVLQLKFPLVEDNKEYKSACYIAAIPDIYRRFKISEQVHGPFDWYFAEMNNPTQILFNLKDMEGTYNLVQAAVQFWNGYEGFKINSLCAWSTSYYLVFIEACKIFRN